MLGCGQSAESTEHPPEATEAADLGDVTDVTDAPDEGSPSTDPVAPDPEDLAVEALMAQVVALAADAMEGRDNGTPGAEAARTYLIAQLEAAGLVPAGADGWLQAFPQGINVVGALPGAGPHADEYVLLTAHYDHLGTALVAGSACKAMGGDAICNGAVDNASGCAVALEVARLLAPSLTGHGRGVLVIFFDAEEDGLRGSAHFASFEPLVPLESIAAVVNVDAVGGAIIKGWPGSLALGAEYATGLRERIVAISAEQGFQTWPVSSFFDGSPDGSRSDHYPFRLEGVPALFMSSGAPPEYHSPFDEPEIIDQAKLLGAARHVLQLVFELVIADERPGFIEEPSPHIGDAEALLSLGAAVMADPSSLGLGPEMLPLLEGWLGDLQGWVEKPPSTPAEWQEYDELIRGIVAAVSSFIGR